MLIDRTKHLHGKQVQIFSLDAENMYLNLDTQLLLRTVEEQIGVFGSSKVRKYSILVDFVDILWALFYLFFCVGCWWRLRDLIKTTLSFWNLRVLISKYYYGPLLAPYTNFRWVHTASGLPHDVTECSFTCGIDWMIWNPNHLVPQYKVGFCHNLNTKSAIFEIEAKKWEQGGLVRPVVEVHLHWFCSHRLRLSASAVERFLVHRPPC